MWSSSTTSAFRAAAAVGSPTTTAGIASFLIRSTSTRSLSVSWRACFLSLWRRLVAFLSWRWTSIFGSLHSCLLNLKPFDGLKKRLLGRVSVQSITSVAHHVCSRRASRMHPRHHEEGCTCGTLSSCVSSSGAARHGLFAAGRNAAAAAERP